MLHRSVYSWTNLLTICNHADVRFSATVVLFMLAASKLFAGSATWATNPTSGDWNTAANWRPQTVPNATTDIATFGASNVTVVTNSDVIVNLDSLVFSSGAPSYTISALDNIDLDGIGIVNNSGTVQSFVAGAFFFNNSSTAGSMVNFTAVGGDFFFNGASSAGAGTFDLTNGNDRQAHMFFNDGSTAGDATINASVGAVIEFFDSSSGGNATLNLSTAAFVLFESNNNAEQMIGNCIGGDQQFGSEIGFEGFSSAGEGIFTTIGGSTSGEQGGFILFDNTATADNATFIINGAMGAGLSGTSLVFIDTTTAAAANITANGGVDGSKGGVISFQKTSTGGTASITLNGNAKLDLSTHTAGVTIGSLAGAGSVLLGANTLTIGSNQSTTFSGVIQGTGGVTKSGTGTLTLTGSNTYTGNTTVTAGVLGISNTRGSGAGAGSVNVQAGTLAGKGIISGAVTIGTGSGSSSGAFLAPAAGTNVQAMLTIQSALIFNADATYAYTFRAKRNRASTDKVIASGVIINSGAIIALSGQTQGRLTTGLTLTLISNTSANPISGTFSNLPDGGIVTINGNNFQASYSGGDGNDLTLTVVP
jgi:autotransporter-associated beta strand protein